MAYTRQVYCIRHYLSAGGQFDGTDPGGDTTLDEGVLSYPINSVGGLFDFLRDAGMIPRPVAVYQVLIKLASSQTWKISISDAGGDVVVAQGNGDAVYWNDASPMILDHNQKLKVETGAGGAGYCFVYFAPLDIGGW